MTANRSILAGLVVVGAFVGGRYLAPDPEPPAAHVITTPGKTVVREVVRHVDRTPPPALETPAAAEAPDEAPPEVTAKHAAALDRARGIIGSAVAMRVWTKADAQALLEVLPNLDRAGADEVMTALIAPINAGQMKVETSGSLLDPT